VPHDGKQHGRKIIRMDGLPAALANASPFSVHHLFALVSRCSLNSSRHIFRNCNFPGASPGEAVENAHQLGIDGCRVVIAGSVNQFPNCQALFMSLSVCRKKPPRWPSRGQGSVCQFIAPHKRFSRMRRSGSQGIGKQEAGRYRHLPRIAYLLPRA